MERSDASGSYFALTDHLGSVRDVINTSGTVKDSIQYDAFGNITDSDANYRGTYSYTGRQFDVEDGAAVQSVRWYNPNIGTVDNRRTRWGLMREIATFIGM